MPRQSHLLSPYRPPTSYPVALTAEEAAAWLNGWAALWHPCALKEAVLPPLPASSYDHGEPAPGGVYALAAGPALHLADDWRSRAREAGAIVFDATADRAATFEALKQALNDPAFDAVPAEVVQAFVGVGYAHLVLDTLFEAANHDKLLDLEGFWKDIQEAAEACMDAARCKTHLTEAALKLTTAREQLVSSGIQFVDVVLRDDVTLHEPWPRPLTADQPLTLVATAATLEKLKEKHAAAFEELKCGAVDLAVGVALERDDSLLPVESQLWSLRQARRRCEALLGKSPTLFARGTADYHAHLPGWLTAAGFTGALLLNREQGVLPSFASSVIQWPGPEGRIVNAYTRTPLPAGDANTFFNLAYHLHDATQREATPHFALLHTGMPAAGYADLLAVHALAPVFGTFAGLESLLADSHTADYVSVPYADEYAVDHLDNAVSKRHVKDPISRFAVHQRTRRQIDSIFALAALHRTLTLPSADAESELAHLAELEDHFEEGHGVQLSLEPPEKAFANRLAERLLLRGAADTPGRLVFNTCNFPRRVALEFPDSAGPIALAEPVKASEYENGVARVVVEVPGLGYAWLPRGDARTALPKPRLKTAEGVMVRNEFLEAEVDPATGGVKALRDTRLRIHRLGQMLVWNPGGRMVADEVKVTSAGAALGEITCRGKLVDDSGTLATFTQRVRAWVGRPVLEMRITLEPVQPPAGSCWQNYFGCRFAWADERAAFSRGVQGTLHPSGLERPTAPDFIEIRFGKERTCVFTGGLPFVQKHSRRAADVVLVCEGETATTFDLLLAFDRDYPMATATGWTTPTPVVDVERGPPPTGPGGWLMNVDLPSLVMTALRPAPPEDGHGRAVQMRLLETAGLAAAADLRFARDPQRVSTCDLAGHRDLPLTMAGDTVPLTASAGELLSLKAEWS